MKRSLKAKLILSYLAVALLTVLVVSAVIRLTSGRSLMDLVVEQQTARLTESVQTYYTANGSLDGFFDYFLQSNRVQPAPDQTVFPDKPSREGDIRGVYGLVDAEYRVLMPTFGYQIGQILPEDRLKRAIAVKVDGKTIAWILPDTSKQFDLSTEEKLFLQRTNLAIGLSALAGVLVAVAMGFLLAGGVDQTHPPFDPGLTGIGARQPAAASPGHLPGRAGLAHHHLQPDERRPGPGG